MRTNEKTSNARKPRGKASTLEILGAGAGQNKVPVKWAGQHAELIKLREYIAGQRRNRAAGVEAEPTLAGVHMADAATDSYDRDWALAMATSDQSVLYEVTQALTRIANGTYGVCELTGNPIEPGRLKALPWTRFCAAAQAELEERGAVARTRLGRLGSYDSLPGAVSAADEDDIEEPADERQAA